MQRDDKDLGSPAGTVSAELEALYSALSHELRSPLGAVLNYASILELDYASQLDADAQEIIARLRRNADAVVALLDALARMAGIERAELRAERLDLASLARAAFDGVRPAGSRAELAIGELPELTADAALLGIALEELFTNAIKFSASREKAHVAISGWAGDADSIVLCVRDDGAGFDPRFARKLFSVFSRLNPRGVYPGAGVGLALVRRIAERHGGRVWAESEPDAGARFYLELPAGAGAPE